MAQTHTTPYSSPRPRPATRRPGASFARAIIWHAGIEPPHALVTVLTAAGTYAGGGSDVLSVCALAFAQAGLLAGPHPGATVAILVTDVALEPAAARLADRLARFTDRVVVKRADSAAGLTIRAIQPRSAAHTNTTGGPKRRAGTGIEPKPTVSDGPGRQDPTVLDAIFERTRPRQSLPSNPPV